MVSRTLACSVVLGTVAVLGCDSQPSGPDAQAKAANQETFRAVNEELTKSVGASPRHKGALPKSVKGGLGGKTAPGDL